MKKLLVIGAIMMLPLSASALGWNTLSGMGKESVEPKHEYKLNTSGNSPRVYEWTPKDNKNITCVFVAGTKSSGVACYPKK